MAGSEAELALQRACSTVERHIQDFVPGFQRALMDGIEVARDHTLSDSTRNTALGRVQKALLDYWALAPDPDKAPALMLHLPVPP